MLIDQLTVLPADAAELASWSLTGAEVREVLTAASRARTSLDALMARLAGAADSMGLPREDGATSTTAWVANTTGIHKGEASKLSRLGRRLGPESRFAVTGAAWAAGGLSTDQAGVILDALDKLPEHIDHEPLTLAEKVLIEQAAELNLDDLKRAANRVLEHVDPDGADEALGQQVRAEEQRAFDQTRLTMKNKNNGMTDGTFRLPTADVDVLRAAIEGIIAPRRNGENARRWELGLDDWKNLSHDRKAGHAFVELLAHLPTDALPLHGGLAATVAVTVDVGRPAHRPGHRDHQQRHHHLSRTGTTDGVQRTPRRPVPRQRVQGHRPRHGPPALRPPPTPDPGRP